jgi:hypothetical protein
VGVGRREGESEGRMTDRVMGAEATAGEESRECRCASTAKETEMAGAWVTEPQGEEGRVMGKEAEAEERGATEERGRVACK